MKEYVVTFETSEQITYDDFIVKNPSLKVNENTTIKEIETFYKKFRTPGAFQVKLIELQQIKLK